MAERKLSLEYLTAQNKSESMPTTENKLQHKFSWKVSRFKSESFGFGLSGLPGLALFGISPVRERGTLYLYHLLLIL